jgi:hypothetical protein
LGQNTNNDDIIKKVSDESKKSNNARQNEGYANKPSAKYNYKDKKLSVTYYFGPWDNLKAKLRATKEKWYRLWESVDFDNVSFKVIEPILSRKTSEKIKEEIKGYADKYPDYFSGDVFNCVQYAVLKIREVKPRKPSVYGLSPDDRIEISTIAARLYIYLRKIGEKPEKHWPSYIKKFLDTYEIPEYHLKNDLELKSDIGNVMSKYYGIEFGERFWQTFVTEKPISPLRLKSMKHVNPENDPLLNQIFKEFKD